MVAFLKRRDRRRVGDDLQRARAGARDEEPGDGQALHSSATSTSSSMSDLGTGMLQDGIFVRGDWIKDTANQATAVKFLEATFKGWAYCRDHARRASTSCRQAGHGAAEGAPGLADERGQRADLAEQARDRRHGPGRSAKQTDAIATKFKVIKKPATMASYRTRPREEGGREPEGAGRRRHRQELQEGGRRPQGRRQVARSVVSPGSAAADPGLVPQGGR